jgi:hypothetical protein
MPKKGEEDKEEFKGDTAICGTLCICQVGSPHIFSLWSEKNQLVPGTEKDPFMMVVCFTMHRLMHRLCRLWQC